MSTQSISLSKSIINWDSSWQELDLVFGIAVDRNSSELLLEPTDYGATPNGEVQFSDVILLGSDSADRIYAGSNNYIDAKGGNDILFSIDNYTGNQIVGGTGSDIFYLQATNNVILGGEIFTNSEFHDLSSDVALADFEADTYLIDSSLESVLPTQFLKIYDFEVGRDSLFIDGLKIETSEWVAARELLSNYNININASPESTLKNITISLLEDAPTTVDLSPYILDRDNDTLRVVKLIGPDWISFDGTVLTADTPSGTTKDELHAIDFQIGYTDGKAVTPFSARLIFNNIPSVAAEIPNQKATQDAAFSFAIPANTFVDLDENDTLTLSATLADGSALPTWLTFTPETGVFSGTPSYRDVGSIEVKVTATDAAASVSDAFFLFIANINDDPTGNVSITGSPTQGETLTADVSTINDLDGLGSFSFQWQADGTDITGATAKTFVPTQDQVGKAMSVVVSYVDGGSTAETLTSIATAAVSNTNDRPTGTVVIDGTATQGQTLTANTEAIADADGLGDFSYQWKADGTDITGATTKTFVPTQAQVGKAISVVASYTDGGNTAETLTSLATAAVSNTNDSPTGIVAIDGTATQGQTLTANTDAIADADGLGSFSYQWKADGTDINGATQSTFALTQDQVGKAITVTASYTDGFGASESLTSDATSAVANTNDSPTGTVVIDGTATQGQTLTANTDAINDADGLGDFSYQWKADGTDITGATTKTFVPTQAQVGKAISVVVSYTDGGSTAETLTSDSTSAVEDINDSPIGNVKISGVAIEKETLRAVVGSIADADGVPTLSEGSFQFQWKADGVEINGATSDSIELTQEQVGKPVSVVVNYTDKGGFTQNTIDSAPTAPVINRNDKPFGKPLITGTPTQGQTLTVDTSNIQDADGLRDFSYQWQADGININGATSEELVLSQAQVGRKISVVTSYTDQQGSQESVRSATTQGVANTNDSPTGTVVIDGTATQGEKLTANTDAINDADGLGDFSYQWKADGTEITGATAKTFVLTQDQVGKAISVVASYTDGLGENEQLTSKQTTKVENINDLPTGRPVIQGQLAEGLEVEAKTDSITDKDGIDQNSYTYQWKANGEPIDGATSKTLTLTAAEIGKTISVVTTYTDLQGREASLESAISATVVSTESLLSGTVSIKSNNRPIEQGNELIADTTSDPLLFNNQTITQLLYQWFADGTPIEGETSDRFTPQQDHVGQLISVQVTDASSTAFRISDLTTAVDNVNDDPTGLASITGLTDDQPIEDATISVDASSIQDQDGRSGIFNYEWTADNTAIAGATLSTFTPTDEQVGKLLAVKISYTDDFGQAEEIDQEIGTVGAVNDEPTGSLSLTGLLLTGQTLNVTDTLSDADGLGARTYTWQRSGSNSSWIEITSQSNPTDADYGTYQLTADDAGNQIRVVATYVDQQGFEEAITTNASSRVISKLSEGRQLTYETAEVLAELQWERRRIENDNWQALSGENKSSLLTETTWGGQEIRLTINGIPLPGIKIEAIDSGVGILEPLKADGPLKVGVTLTAGLPLSDPDGLDLNSANLQYQWQRYATANNDWKLIDGGTNAEYTTTNADADQSVRAQVTYTDVQGFKNTIFSNSLKPQDVAPPEPKGSFDAIAGEGILTAAAYDSEGSTIPLSGTITGNGQRNTTVSISFGGQFRQASVSEPDAKKTSLWEYTITEVDQRFLTTESSNPITATLTREENGKIGSNSYTNLLTISPDIELPGSSPNSAADPTQSDGIKQEVKDAAKEVLNDALPGDLAERIGLPNVAAAPLGSASSFEAGSDAPADSFGVFDLPGNSSAAGLETYTQGENGYSIPNQIGGTDAIPAPDTTSLAAATDPIALTIKDIDPGATIQVDFILPQGSADQLPSDLSQARYFKLNNTNGEFTDYLKDDGSKYYSYSLVNDANNNGSRDQGEAVKLTLELTDGDSKWDRDGIANGVIVDPGILGGNVNDAPTGSVVIDGNATQGQTLTANTETIADADGLGAFSYQWKADGVDINGATTQTFVPTQAQVGKEISVVVSYTDGQGSAETLTSNPTSAVNRLAAGSSATTGSSDTSSLPETGTSTEPSETNTTETNTPVLTVNPEDAESAGSVVINPASIAQGETLVISSSDLEEGVEPVFEINGGVASSAILAIDFQTIVASSTPIDPSRATDGGGTIASNAPQNLSLSLDGVYFNCGAGADSITGSQHSDFLRAGAGDDIIDSGAGDDLVRAGAGNDQITLGSGNDVLYFTADQLDQSIDTLIDFNSAEDSIALGENLTVSFAGNIATFTTEIDGLERSSQLIFSGFDTVSEEWFTFG